MDGDFRTEFTRSPAGLKHRPALVLNADYRPLSYYPLSLWPWQEAIKAKWLDRVDIVAEYDDYVHSPSMQIKIPSVVFLKDYVKLKSAWPSRALIYFCATNFAANTAGHAAI